jgi:hypothetical protein
VPALPAIFRIGSQGNIADDCQLITGTFWRQRNRRQCRHFRETASLSRVTTGHYLAIFAPYWEEVSFCFVAIWARCSALARPLHQAHRQPGNLTMKEMSVARCQHGVEHVRVSADSGVGGSHAD